MDVYVVRAVNETWTDGRNVVVSVHLGFKLAEGMANKLNTLIDDLRVGPNAGLTEYRVIKASLAFESGDGQGVGR